MTSATARTTKEGRGGRGQRGQTLVEFAFALPILALVLFGIFEYGVIMLDQIQLTNASRDAARAGAIHFEASPVPIPLADRTTQATTAAQTSAANLVSCPLPTSNITVTQTPANSNPMLLTVKLQCSYSPITPAGSLAGLFHGSLNAAMTIKSTTIRDEEP